jgi:tRNA pseudouridine32 synthase/23S rRNA pseudouridine746 synthase
VRFLPFKSDIRCISLPENFTFPFYYSPHPLAIIASKELQEYLKKQTDFVHNFGFDRNDTTLPIGKMFGVLVVENEQKELGYLAGFSGKLADKNHHKLFVPPVFDILEKGGFFRVGEIEVNEITLEIEGLEKDEKYLEIKKKVATEQFEIEKILSAKKQ